MTSARPHRPLAQVAALTRREALLAFAACATPALAQTAPDPAAFAKFLADLWPLAEAKGISRKTFDAATGGLRYDARIAAHTEAQAEFTVPIWTYLANAVIAPRIVVGRREYQGARDILARAREAWGVDPGVIMGAWGCETEFGAFSGNENVFNALATLAFIRYQGDLGRDELLAALAIVEHGDATPAQMRGSWAGAMGQPQFMPSSYLKYAVDFDGDGKRDIWRSKADVLGSMAFFFYRKGWTPGLPWAVEATLPSDYKFAADDFDGSKSFAAFGKAGARAADASALPKEGAARLYMPAGVHGPILLITHNFDVIKTYNNSNAYVLAVGLLGDAVLGGRGLRAPWPVKEHWPNRAELKSVQMELKARGFDIGEIDGRAGPRLEQAIRAFQFAQHLTPDGFASAALIARLKAPS